MGRYYTRILDFTLLHIGISQYAHGQSTLLIFTVKMHCCCVAVSLQSIWTPGRRGIVCRPPRFFVQVSRRHLHTSYVEVLWYLTLIGSFWLVCDGHS